MQAIAKLYGPEESFPVGGEIGDPKVVAAAFMSAAIGQFFRAAEPDLGECSHHSLH